MELAQDQKTNRADLVRERQKQADTLAEMKAQAAGLSAQRRVAAADLGPLVYIGAIIGQPPEGMLKYFVLLVACLLDWRLCCCFSLHHKKGGSNHGWSDSTGCGRCSRRLRQSCCKPRGEAVRSPTIHN